ncbi:MAG TPA: hypothetical protein PLB67_17290 [Candidatus Hydrogenedentes bacterium]|nr:hypothetical protein [Candidatus Hydrogenedentota bacterium]
MKPDQLAAALPEEARAIYFEARGWLDAADAFLAARDGLTPDQARSRARNAARNLGASWPDRYEYHSIDDREVRSVADRSFFGSDPGLIFEARQSAELALAARDAARRLAEADLADLGELDTADLAARRGITRRRAQQIRRAAILAAAAGQESLL